MAIDVGTIDGDQGLNVATSSTMMATSTPRKMKTAPRPGEGPEQAGNPLWLVPDVVY